MTKAAKSIRKYEKGRIKKKIAEIIENVKKSA